LLFSAKAASFAAVLAFASFSFLSREAWDLYSSSSSFSFSPGLVMTNVADRLKMFYHDDLHLG
jgi:hypothetical protein